MSKEKETVKKPAVPSADTIKKLQSQQGTTKQPGIPVKK